MCYFTKLEHISSQFAQSRQEKNSVGTNFRLSRDTPRALAVTRHAAAGRRFAAKLPLWNAAEPRRRFARVPCNAAKPWRRFAAKLPLRNAAEPGLRFAKLLCNAAEPGGRFAKLLSKAAEPGRRLPLTDCAVGERGVFVKELPKLSVKIYLHRLSVMTDESGVMDWARSCFRRSHTC